MADPSFCLVFVGSSGTESGFRGRKTIFGFRFFRVIWVLSVLFGIVGWDNMRGRSFGCWEVFLLWKVCWICFGEWKQLAKESFWDLDE